MFYCVIGLQAFQTKAVVAITRYAQSELKASVIWQFGNVGRLRIRADPRRNLVVAQCQLLHILSEWTGLRWVEGHQAVSRAEAGRNFLITVGKSDIAKRIVLRQGVKVPKPSSCAGIPFDSLTKFLPVNSQLFLNRLQRVRVRGVFN